MTSLTPAATAWLFLAAASVFEIVFAASMKASQGFTRPAASAVTVLAVIGGIGFLTLAMRTLPVSVAYPIWVAAGALGAVFLGALAFGEVLTPLKLASVAVVVLGVVGLKLSNPGS